MKVMGSHGRFYPVTLTNMMESKKKKNIKEKIPVVGKCHGLQCLCSTCIPRYPVIPPEVNGVFGMFLVSKYLLRRCLDV